jgi:hypothetical protein
VKIHVTIEANPRAWRRQRKLFVVGVFLVAIALPAAVWASDKFFDVPDDQPFHNQISAIAGAGITTGCGEGNYCPAEFVRRDAMAAFMHRGYGRAAYKVLPTASVPSAAAVPTGWSLGITVGLPSNALAGAAGFIKVDGVVSVCNNTATQRLVRARLLMDGVAIGGDTTYQSLDVDNSSGECGNLALNGVARITSSGVHTASVEIQGGDGASVVANGHLTNTYVPFGSTGTNTLGAAGTSAEPGELDR